MTVARDVGTALRKASALRDVCLRLPHVPTEVELERLRRFETLIGSPESAGEADIEAMVAGWKQWWRESQTAKLATMSGRVPRDVMAKSRYLASYATAAGLATIVYTTQRD